MRKLLVIAITLGLANMAACELSSIGDIADVTETEPTTPIHCMMRYTIVVSTTSQIEGYRSASIDLAPAWINPESPWDVSEIRPGDIESVSFALPMDTVVKLDVANVDTENGPVDVRMSLQKIELTMDSDEACAYEDAPLLSLIHNGKDPDEWPPSTWHKKTQQYAAMGIHLWVVDQATAYLYASHDSLAPPWEADAELLEAFE